MRNKLIIMLGFLGLVANAKADVKKANALTPEESRKIASALEILKDKQVLSKDENDKFDLDKDVIQKLKAEGYLKKKHSDIQTVCSGDGGHQ